MLLRYLKSLIHNSVAELRIIIAINFAKFKILSIFAKQNMTKKLII